MKPIIPSLGSPTWADRMVQAATSGQLLPEVKWTRKPQTQASVRSKHVGDTSRFKSSESFIQILRPLAKKTASYLGIDPDLLIAQASLETGWGKKMQGKNLFNIKAGKGWSGSSTKQNTTEYYNGQAVRVSDKFRRYQSYEDAFGDYLKLVVLNPRYQQALNHGGDAYTYIKGLQQAGYATDPKYADKVLSIYRSIKSI